MHAWSPMHVMAMREARCADCWLPTPTAQEANQYAEANRVATRFVKKYNRFLHICEPKYGLPLTVVDPQALATTSELIGEGSFARVYGSVDPKVSPGRQGGRPAACCGPASTCYTHLSSPGALAQGGTPAASDIPLLRTLRSLW